MSSSRRSLTPSELCPVGDRLEIDEQLLQAAFSRGLRSGPDYLQRLGRACRNDSQLEKDVEYVLQAFAFLQNLVGDDWERSSKEFRLSDVSDYLSDTVQDKNEVVFRIGCIAHQLENVSPTGQGRRESGGTSRSVMSNFSGTKESDEYEDDFDADDDEIADELHGAEPIQQRFRQSLEEPLQEPEELCGEDTRRDLQLLKQRGERYSRGGVGASSQMPRGNGGRGGGGGGGDVYSIDETYVQNHQEYRQSASAPTLQRPRQVERESSSFAPTPRLHAEEKSPVERESGGMVKRSSSAGMGYRKSKSVVSWIREKKYQLGIKIGSGSFGEVFQCMNNEGKLFAVKQLHIAGQRNALESLGNEIQLMRDCKHDNIVRYIGAAVDESEAVLNIFQEWVPGGSVAQMLKNFGAFPEKVMQAYSRQILCGLCFLHEKGIIHRDIKGGNVLVHENGTVKLADFGASTKTSLDKTQETESIKGTPYFMAPEVLAQSKYGRKGDIWAVGCTMIQMLTGQPPWKDRNLGSMVQLHLLLQSWNGPPPYDHEAVSEDCRGAIAWCFQHSSTNRPTAEDLSCHPFLKPDEDLGNSWGSQQFGASGDFDGLQMGGADAGRDDDGVDLGGSMKDLMSQLNKIAGQDGGGGGMYHSVEHSHTESESEQTMRVAAQLAERQRSREQKQRDSKAADEDEEIPLPPSRYTPPRPAPGGNPYARGANGSRPKDLHVLASAAAAAAAADAVAEAAAAQDRRSDSSRPSSQEARDGRSSSKPTTPQSRSGSAAVTPTRVKAPSAAASPTSADPAEALKSLRVITTGARPDLPGPMSFKTTPRGRGGGSASGSAASAGQFARTSSAGRISHVRGERGLGSARDGEVTPHTPHTPYNTPLTPQTPHNTPMEDRGGRSSSSGSSYHNNNDDDDGVYRPVAAGDDGELLVNWECQFCLRENSPYQTMHCDHCAKMRVQKIVHDFKPTHPKKGSPAKQIDPHQIYK